MTTAQEKKIKKFCKHLVREKSELRSLYSVFPAGVEKIAHQIDVTVAQVGATRGYGYLVKDFLEAQIGLVNYQKELLKYLEQLSSSPEDLVKVDHEPWGQGLRCEPKHLRSSGVVEMYIERIKSTLINSQSSLSDANPWGTFWNLKRLKDEISQFIQS